MSVIVRSPGVEAPVVAKFRQGPDAWWRSPVRDGVINAAKKMTSSGDAGGRRRFESEARWIGGVGEIALRAWLRGMGLEAKLNGGVDHLPDIEVAGVGVAVKTTGHSGLFRPEYWLPYPKAQLDAHRHDEVFWCAYRLGDYPSLTLIGALPTGEFLDRAEVLREGETMESGKPAKYDFYRVRAREVQDPVEWLCRLTLPATDTTEGAA